MRAGLKFHITKHFARRLAERQISAENVKTVVNYADEEIKLQRGRNGGNLIRFTKSFGNRKLIAVAEIKDNNCWLATAYYEY